MEFHKIHCTNCGETVSADQLAVNLDRIISDHLKNQVERMGESSLRELSELFRLIKVGLYLSKYDMATREGILSDQNKLKITSGYVLKFLQRRYQVILFDSEGKLSTEALKRLYNRIQFYHGSDTQGGFEKVKRLVETLNKNRETILAECTCEFRIQKDDRGNEFISQVITRSLDGPDHVYQHMVCPRCGNEFYITAGSYEERIIVLLGSSRVGKTAYLAALVSKINGYLEQKLGGGDHLITVTSIQDERYKAFNEKILADYLVGRKPAKTDVDEKLENPIPLVSLRVKTRAKTVVYTVVDMPGEVFVPKDSANTQEADGSFIINRRKICCCADAFWLCVDPVQIDRSLRMVNEQSPAEDRVQCDIDMVLSNVCNMMSLMGEDKGNVPGAVILTKSDLLDKIDGLYQADEPKVCLTPNGCLDGDAVKKTSKIVLNYLKSGSDTVRDISGLMEDIFLHRNYFSVAAYGVKVDQEQRAIAPYGIAMPFLWTMASFGDIPIERQQMGVKKTGLLKRLFGKADGQDVQVSTVYTACTMADLYE